MHHRDVNSIVTVGLMFAVYAREPNRIDMLASLVVGERPEPDIPKGWVRVKVSHATLNRHDIFTLMGVTTQPEPIPFPMILGMGSADWRGDETLDPQWHILSERVAGTMADYVAVPKRNSIPKPEGISSLNASLLGTAWLTAFRSPFTKLGLRPGQTLLVQAHPAGCRRH